MGDAEEKSSPAALGHASPARLRSSHAHLLIYHCAVLDPPGSPSQLYDLHTPPEEIGEAARDSGVKRLLLSHLAPDVEGQQAAVRKSIRASYAEPVAFASDKLHVPVGK